MIANSSLAAITVAILLTLAYRGHGITTVLLSMALLSLITAILTRLGPFTWLLTALLFIGIPFAITSLRQQLFSKPIRSVIRHRIRPYSTTENKEIDNNSVWWDGELFGGQPAWHKLLSSTKPELSEEEQAFIHGPVKELCHMLEKSRMNHKSNRLPQSIIKYVCGQGFLGIIIPKQYGGLEFSPFAQSEILLRLSSTGSGINYLLSVPNSIGLSDLMINYATDAQKEYYLPRFANGQEIPCSILTSHISETDAISITNTGTVCMGEWQGDEVIGMRLNFSKRNIMLSPIATLVGFAFRLKDPDKLIGDVTEYGITCALVPRNTKGIEVGGCHPPLNEAFLDGPIQGKDVFVPLSFIIGGPEMAGKGWHMLLDCYSVAHTVTLTTAAVATSKHSLLCSYNYAVTNQQFGVPLIKFRCIQKQLARTTGLNYILDAARLQTIQAVMEDNKPSMLMEILKHYTPEIVKQCVIDTVDIHACKILVNNPKNYIANIYESIPAMISIEETNISTRNPMIFRQGVIRSHPFAMHELTLAHAEVSQEVIAEFDTVLTSHIGNMISNFARMLLMGLGLSREAAVTDKQHLLPYYHHFNRLSSLFSLITDIALLSQNTKLKFNQILPARLGDLLTMLFLGSMVIKQHEESQKSDEEWPVAQWALDYLLYQYQVAFDHLMENWPSRYTPTLLKRLAFPPGSRFSAPQDKLEKSIVELITLDSATRTDIAYGLNIQAVSNNSLPEVIQIYLESLHLQPILKKVKYALRSGNLTIPEDGNLTNTALNAELISEYEAEQLRHFDSHLMAVLQVCDLDGAKLPPTQPHEHDDLQMMTG
jgi:acyl-CoA dehydrogenase